MEILWLGHSSFLLRGKLAKIVTDPFDPGMVGFKFPKTEADIVTVSHNHPDHNTTADIVGTPFIISGPGEYEVKGISVFGVATFHDEESGAKRGKNTAYTLDVDGLRVCHLGDLGHKLSDGQLTEIGNIDVLLIPVGGFFTIDAKVAGEVVGKLEPKIVIPMHYKIPGLSQTNFAGLADLEPFLTEMGVTAPAPLPKLVVTPDKLPEQLQVVTLERRTG